MPNDKEIKYSYEGDVSSLAKATTDAIKLLGMYEQKADQTFAKYSTRGKKFGIASDIRAEVASATTELNKLKQSLESITRAGLKAPEADTTALGSSMQGVESSGIKSKSSAAELLASKQQLTEMLSTIRAINAGLGQTANQAMRVTSLADNIKNKFSAVRAALQSGSGIRGYIQRHIGGFDSLIAKLQSYRDSAKTGMRAVKLALSEVSSAFKRVEDSSEEADDSIGDMAKSSKRGLNGLASVITGFGNLLTRASSRLNGLTKASRSLGNSLVSLKSILGTLTGLSMGTWLAQGLKSAIDFTETQNLFNVAMGDSIEVSREFVDRMAELYGMDPKGLMDTAGTLYLLSDAIQMPAEASANMALTLTKAANDIASLYNTSVEQVSENLQSAMMGMSRAVKKYGFDITEASLDQTALNYGLSQTAGTMNEATKRALRYLTLMDQMRASTQQLTTTTDGETVAMGDFARTIEQPANQLRILKEQIIMLGRAVGNFLITPFAKAIAYINGVVMAVRMVLQYISSLLGVLEVFGGSSSSSVADSTQSISSGFDDVKESASAAADAVKSFLAPIDELNVMPSPTADLGRIGDLGEVADEGIVDPVLLDAIANMELELENIRMKAVEVRDAILEFLGFKVDKGTILGWDSEQLEANLIEKFPQWTKSIQAFFDNWGSIVSGFKALWQGFVDVVGAVVDKIKGKFDFLSSDDALAQFFSTIGDSLKNIGNWVSEHADAIATAIIGVITAIAGFKLLAPIASIVVGIVGAVTLFGGSIVTTLGICAGVAAAIALLVASFIKFATTNEEFAAKASKAWENFAAIAKKVWDSLLKPLITGLVDIVGAVLYELWDIILELWNGVLAPLLDFLLDDLGPTIKQVVDSVVEIVKWLVDIIGGLIKNLIDILKGITDFLVGVFTGDWKRALKGIAEIVVGVAEGVLNVITAVVNSVISVINLAISFVWDALMSLVNGILWIINQIGSLFGAEWNLNVSASAPQIGYIPALADGGVVTGPTLAMVGEGRYDEAVIPLGNSPQVKQLASDIAQQSGSSEQVTLLREQNGLLKAILDKTGVTLDGMSLAKQMYSYNGVVRNIHGDSLINV